MQRDGRIAARAERIDLILHQRDERGDYDIGAAGDRGRNLVAERLAAPGRHHHQRVAPIEAGSDGLGLQRPQGFIAPEAAHGGENFLSCAPGRVLHHARHLAPPHREYSAFVVIRRATSTMIINN